MRPFVLFALAFLPMVAVAAQPTGPVISKTEVRTARPEETHRRLRDVIWHMFEQEDLRRERRPTRPLSDVRLRTGPRGTEIPGLCRNDGVTVRFAPATGSPRETNANTPMQAVGLESRAHFRFLEPPSNGYYEIEDHDRTEPRCAALDPSDISFFEAPSERVATDGYLSFLNLQQALRGATPPPLECDLFTNDTQSCRDIILAFDQSSLSLVRECESRDPFRLCFHVYTSDRRLRLIATGHARPGPPPGQILQAELEGLIVMSHERID